MATADSQNQPQNIGPYRLVRLLAQGGMAEIWLADHPQHGECVVKRVHPHLTSNTEFLMMFVDEARIAARLNHPGCVHIFDLGKEGSTYYIAMEYIHGEDIRSIARQARAAQIPLPRKLAVAIIMGAAEGLHYAHELMDGGGRPLNIVHRDVSPQNILVTFDGRVRIVDFGIAKAADQANRTRSGVLKGKYAYMAPEQILGVPLDRRTDVFALGILLYELTTGRRLFKAKTELETMRRITQNIFTPPAAASPGYPPDLERIVLKAISNDRINRYESAQALRDDLAAFLEAHRVTVTEEDLAELMKQVFAERLAAIDVARQSGDASALLDARFGLEGSDASDEIPAPPAPAPSSPGPLMVDETAAPTTLDREPLITAEEDEDGFTDRAPPVSPMALGRAPRPAPVEVGEEGLAPTQLAAVLPGAIEPAAKITETHLPAVHLPLPAPAPAPAPEHNPDLRRTEPTLAAVWIPPEPQISREGPRPLEGVVGDARLGLPSEGGAAEATLTEAVDPAQQGWIEAPAPAEDWELEPPTQGSGLLSRIVAILLVAGACVAGLAWYLSAPAASVAPAEELAVALQSTPPGAEIHLDSLRLRQKTPTVLTGLERGRAYEVRLSFPTGESWVQTFKPEEIPGNPPTVIHTFPGMGATPEPAAAPAGASLGEGYLTITGGNGLVFVDGEQAGKLPLSRYPLPAGPHAVEIQRGKRKQRFEIEILEGETLVKKLGRRQR
ncbi:MAG: serine/threonine protein kinase [Deltaproteobacteria bacterium]|nr:serine/threonine protein kinase [Deltaproteobacteria bacterium]